jgi:two-component system chemotaxis sensor kinase CheA
MDMDTPHWRLHLGMGMDALRNGLDPLSFIRHLGTLGTLCEVRAHPDRVPALEDLDAESCWLDFEILLQSAAPRQAIADVFDFLQDDCTLEIRSEATPPERRTPAAQPPAEEGRFLRVSADKLDRLVDLIGTLFIAGSGAGNAARESGHARCIETTQRVQTLVQSTRESALALRMVPIGQTFRGVQRVVRDMDQTLGKDVALQILGGDTELDHALADAIADPLMHLVRNSLEHGLESPDERRARDKPARGQLCLQAFQEAGSVVLEISDDGRGLETTDLPDRGVGMDLVRRQVEALHGQLHLTSLPGQGTTVQIRLPVTPASVAGVLTRVGRVRYMLPREIVAECIDHPPGLPSGPHRARGCLDLRGQTLPFLDLRTCFGHGGERPARQHLVVVRCSTGQVGLLVDQRLGEHQAVITPLGPLFRHLPCLAGSTLLGGGEVALVLDVEALARLHAAPSRTADATPWTTTPFRTCSTF